MDFAGLHGAQVGCTGNLAVCTQNWVPDNGFRQAALGFERIVGQFACLPEG
jgi:hypothetical protein